jgi:type II secretory pathway component PulJ
MSRGCRGLTLVELIVAGGLAAIVSTILYASLIMATRYHHLIADAGHTQQAAMRALTAVTAAATGGLRASVRADSDGIVFASAQSPSGVHDVDESGRLLWQKFVCFYVQDGVLYRRERAFAPSATPPDTPSPREVASDAALPSSVMVRGIASAAFSASIAQVTARSETYRTTRVNEVALQSRLDFRQ